MKDVSRQQIVDENYEAFVKNLPDIIATQKGKFALMRNQEIVAFFDTDLDAITAGNIFYDDGQFTIQEVTQTPINLGIFSCLG
jgi:hypothetical protein